MGLNGKKIKVSYKVSDFYKFLTGIVVEEDANFIAVKGLKDGSIFRINKESIIELIELNGDNKNGRT